MVGRGDLGRVEGKLEEVGKLGNIFSPLFLSPTFTGIRNNGGGSQKRVCHVMDRTQDSTKLKGWSVTDQSLKHQKNFAFDIVSEMFGQKT